MNVIQCVQILLEERKGELGIGLSNNARYTMHNITSRYTVHNITSSSRYTVHNITSRVVGTQCTTLLYWVHNALAHFASSSTNSALHDGHENSVPCAMHDGFVNSLLCALHDGHGNSLLNALHYVTHTHCPVMCIA